VYPKYQYKKNAPQMKWCETAKEGEMKAIGVIQTCFPEKFGVPRQSLLVPSAWGVVTLHPEFAHPDVFLHLESFSHVWLLYHFDRAQNPNHPKAWQPTIIPPRIDAPKRVGVFASRSPHRPNPIGMSVVKLDRLDINTQGVLKMYVRGVDILDGTPIFDIKPYVPYTDLIPDASSGWIKNEIEKYPVQFSASVRNQLAAKPDCLQLISEVLAYDPRPRSQREMAPIHDPIAVGKKFYFRILSYDVHWEVGVGSVILVTEVRLV
jgi:tRNA-Thr(GGU) m(6)t(6)A37 methyltransferase TsaA